MNVERILHLADVIEAQPHEKTGDSFTKSGFNMNYMFHDCGAPGCIAGWACYVGDLVPSSFEAAAKYLGISYGVEMVGAGDELFYQTLPDQRCRDVTPAQAARTLRHLAATGEVDWSLPAEES